MVVFLGVRQPIVDKFPRERRGVVKFNCLWHNIGVLIVTRARGLARFVVVAVGKFQPDFVGFSHGVIRISMFNAFAPDSS